VPIDLYIDACEADEVADGRQWVFFICRKFGIFVILNVDVLLSLLYFILLAQLFESIMCADMIGLNVEVTFINFICLSPFLVFLIFEEKY
jgi:hypothetical protein